MNDKISQLPKPIRPKQTAESARSLLAGVADALNGPAPTPDTAEPERYIRLPLSQIQMYEKNPRIARNTQFDALKESFRANGIGTLLLHVTKRPGESVYTTAFGGGTRLRAVQELYSETQDERFSWVRCLIQPFKDDLSMQAAHLAENNQRNDLSFWDNAKATQIFYLDLCQSLGRNLSGREFAAESSVLGWQINATAWSFYQFAVANFSQFRTGVLDTVTFGV